MRLRFSFLLSRAALGALVTMAACAGADSAAPSHDPPAALAAVSPVVPTAPVGTSVPGGLVVRVADAAGRPVEGATVAFAVTLGNGSTSPRIAVTDANGRAATDWTTGTVVGANEVTASVSGVDVPVKFATTGVAGAVSAIMLSTRNARLVVGTDTARFSAKSLDVFGNVTAPTPTYVVRDPSLVTVDSSGLIRAERRGSSTYVVAAAGGVSDSVRVTVLSAGQSVCTGLVDPLELSVGQVLTGLSAESGVCVHAASANDEFALVPYYDSNVASATIRFEVYPQNTAPLGLPSATAMLRTNLLPREPGGLVPDDAFEARLRDRERAEAAKRRPLARVPGGARFDVRRTAAAAAVPAIGDLLQLNANANDFCDNPEMRTGRVVAVTNKAIVVADTANPDGGFSADEYRSIGVTFDTLVDRIDRAAFGDPSDIDGNGHVIMFFTRAVNALTPPSASSVVLGFFYQRDLYPKTGAPGPCAGSNVGEMFYLMVPDTGGVVNGNRRTKAQVVTFTDGTVAHEYQHLINASRRMYVNAVGPVFEEKWLDEGLSHEAEELNFWAASGRAPRTNLGASLFGDPRTKQAYSTFAFFNTQRYALYLGRSESQSPIGRDLFDDDLQTRGAIWSFLRYAADRRAAGNENAFWFKLANGPATGVANLANVLGDSVSGIMRDWAISVFMDDNGTGVDSRYQQPSWNLRSILTNDGTSTAFPLLTRPLTDGTTTALTLASHGVSFLRFSVASGQDALLTMTSGGAPLPSTVQLALVRVR
jgi:hypothetical protein